jgi:hypothetical protein
VITRIILIFQSNGKVERWQITLTATLLYLAHPLQRSYGETSYGETSVRLPPITVDQPNTKIYAYGAPQPKGKKLGVLHPTETV